MGWPKGVPLRPEMIAKRLATLATTGGKRRRPVAVDGAECWRCTGCLALLPASAFYAATSNTSGLHSRCKPCHIAQSLASRDKNLARDANREHMVRARRTDPERFRAWDRARKGRHRTFEGRARQALNAAVRRGDVTRGLCCSACGASGRIEGHHPDYAKTLSVVWLCTRCHGKVHRHAE